MMGKRIEKAIGYGQAYQLGERWAPLYAALGWRWAGSDDTPTVDEIADKILRLAKHCKRGGNISTGGLTVREEDGVVMVSFSDEHDYEL